MRYFTKRDQPRPRYPLRRSRHRAFLVRAHREPFRYHRIGEAFYNRSPSHRDII